MPWKQLSYQYLKAHPPTPRLITKAIENAYHVHTYGVEWELVLIPIKHLNPTEEIYDEIDPDLISKMGDDPTSVPPLLVSGEGDFYDIIDGHHRTRAAEAAGIGWLWALNGDWYPW